MPDISSPTSEQIKAAMLSGTPVEYGGCEYARITAYIYRISERTGIDLKRRAIMQVELLDKNGNSVVITSPENIIIKERD